MHMVKVTAAMIQELRLKTGISMLDCKNALEQANGDIEKAIEFLRKKGAKVAEKRSGNATKHGLVHAYIHPGANFGVMVEIGCETDFSANTDTMRAFAHDVCLQIAAQKPLCLEPADLDPALVAKEREIMTEQVRASGKPEKIAASIVDGKIEKFYESACLMRQSFIKNDKITIQDLLNELIAKINENIKIRRFVRYELGETVK
jgi:elongation factor Ts